MSASLKLNEVTIRRGAAGIVDGLDLDLRPGHVFWIVGPNGAGKSSLVRVMAKLDPPTAGSVERRCPPGEPFLYFHSEMAMPPASRVGDWSRLMARLMPPGSAAGRTALWPADVGPGRRVGRLSTGERKRLLLDTLLRRPGSLLLDEPYEHLSPDAKGALAALLEERARTAIVVVATNQAVERAEASGGLRLEGGTAERIGPRSGVSP